VQNSLFSRLRCFVAEDSEGNAMVEMALLLPMLMVFITGMVWVGMALNNYMVLTNSVSTGARAFALSPDVTTTSGAITDPCAYAVSTANAASPSLQSVGVTYQVTYTVAGTGKSTKYPSGSAAKSVSCAGIDTTVGDTVQLHAYYPFTVLMYGFPNQSLSIQAASYEVVQ
jgi:Flp pilus assembly protein TadG